MDQDLRFAIREGGRTVGAGYLDVSNASEVKVAYRVFWKKLPGKQIVREEIYRELDDALAEADVAMIGNGRVQISVEDDRGTVHYIGVVG